MGNKFDQDAAVALAANSPSLGQTKGGKPPVEAKNYGSFLKTICASMACCCR